MPMIMKSSKVGAVVLATDQGLGYLAKSFFDNGIFSKVTIYKHGSRTNHWDWYPRESVVSVEELFEECDTILFFETTFYPQILEKARERGKKTVLMVMYECTPQRLSPSLFLSPSLLDKQYYPDSLFIPVPVGVPWRLRTKAQVFVHNAGNGGIGGRNGTQELLEALPHIKSPIKLIIRSQIPLPHVNDPRVEVRLGTFDDIWSEGDVFIFPEKFNGLSLPLQEAYASGMLVMAGDRFPINTWLPTEPLIPVSSYKKERIAVEFDCAVYDPKEIAKMVDLWYDVDITDFSLRGKAWAKENSWDVLRERYLEIL